MPDRDDEAPERLKRTYSDDERAQAVAAVHANNGNVYGTARELGISETTLRQWVNGERARHILPLSDRKRLELADKFEELADMALGVAVDRIGDLNGLQAATVAAIAVDKRALLLGEATSITETRTADDDAKAARVRERYTSRRNRKLVRVEPTDPPVTLTPATTNDSDPAPVQGPESGGEGGGQAATGK